MDIFSNWKKSFSNIFIYQLLLVQKFVLGFSGERFFPLIEKGSKNARITDYINLRCAVFFLMFLNKPLIIKFKNHKFESTPLENMSLYSICDIIFGRWKLSFTKMRNEAPSESRYFYSSSLASLDADCSTIHEINE